MQNINNPISIFINQEDGYKKNHETFLEQLEILYQDFKKRNETRNKKWNQENNQKSKDFLINIESQIYQSPITLVHSQWGQGKTYFFEELIYNCFLENNNQKVNLEKYKFKKILMIDLWKYVNNDDFVNDIIFDVYNFLLPNSKKFKNIFLKIVKSIAKITGIFKSAGMSFLDCLSKSNFSSSYELSNSKRKSVDNINKDLKDIEPTIIIFDNLERLENNVVFTFKLIQKISMINNLLIILPMDKDKLKIANVNLNDVDSWLEKYVTLGNYFVFDQDYKDFLNKKIHNENKKYIDLINKILLVKKYNIRKIENKINFVEVNQTFNISRFHGIEYLCKICEIENYTKYNVKEIVDVLRCININYYLLKKVVNDYLYYIDCKMFIYRNEIDFQKQLSIIKNALFTNDLVDNDEIPRWDFSIDKIDFVNNEIISIINLINKYKLINKFNDAIVSLINKIKIKIVKLNSLLKNPELKELYNVLLSFREYLLKNKTDEIKNNAIKLDDFLSYFSNKIETEINNELKHISL